MFTAQAEGAGQPALRGWDTVTLWGELSATRGRVSDASASGVSLGATKRGRARRLQEALGGGTTHFPLLEPCAPLPSQRASPSGSQSPDVCPHGLHVLIPSTGPGEARCLRAGCGGVYSAAGSPACRSNMVFSGPARRLQARGGRRSVPLRRGRGQPGRLIGRGSLPLLLALHVRAGGLHKAPPAVAPIPRAYWLISCMAYCLTLNWSAVP